MFSALLRCYYALREVEKMVTRSNLDALSPGMLAKLDPLSRIAKQQGAVHWIYVTRNEPEVAPSKYTLRPIDRLRRREELRTKVAGR